MATSVFSISQTAFDAVARAENEWSEMFERSETMRVVDMHNFHGGIDHVDIYPKKIVFHDRGCNNRGRDLVLLRDKDRVGPEQQPIILKV